MAQFTVTVPTDTAAAVTSCLAETLGFVLPSTVTADTADAVAEAELAFACTAIAAELERRVQRVLAQRQRAAAIAALTPPTAPPITVNPPS